MARFLLDGVVVTLTAWTVAAGPGIPPGGEAP
jgi:hypothetical protein